MSHQYSLYPTASASATAGMSLSAVGRSSTSMSSMSFSKGSDSGSRRESKDSKSSKASKASVVSRKDWLEMPLPAGVTIRGRGMWYFYFFGIFWFYLFASVPFLLLSFLCPALNQLTELTCSIPVFPYLHFHSSPPIDSIPSIRFPRQHPHHPCYNSPTITPPTPHTKTRELHTNNRPPYRKCPPSRRRPRPCLCR